VDYSRHFEKECRICGKDFWLPVGSKIDLCPGCGGIRNVVIQMPDEEDEED
jgi:rRNA maturation endonuclease Nob1